MGGSCEPFDRGGNESCRHAPRQSILDTEMNINELLSGNGQNLDAARLDEVIDSLSSEIDKSIKTAPLLNNLSVALKIRFERSGDPADIDRSIDAARASLELTPPEHRSEYLDRRVNLGAGLLAAATRADSPAQLEEAIALFRSASMTVQSSSTATLALASANLCQGLQLLAERTGQAEYLAEAVAAGERAMESIPSNSADRPAVLLNLANALRAYADRTAQWSYLDGAIEYARQGVAIARTGDPRRPGHVSDLALALWSRFELRGELDDLDEAIAASKVAASQTPNGNPRLPGRLTNLSALLCMRFERTGDLGTLKAACNTAKAAVQVTRPCDPQRPGRLSNLASALHVQFHAEGNRDRPTIDNAILAYRDAIDKLPGNHSFLPEVMTHLGNALRTRAYYFNELTDLSEAYRNGANALVKLPADHPFLATSYLSLARTLHALHVLTRNDEHLNAAVRLALTAASHSAAPVSIRIKAAQTWGDWAASRAQDDDAYAYGAADGYAATVSLLPLLAWWGLRRSSQERWLTTWSALPAIAAAYLTESRRTGTAVEVLEMGRSVMWGHLLELRVDLDALFKVDAELARRLDSIRTQLDMPDSRIMSWPLSEPVPLQNVVTWSDLRVQRLGFARPCSIH